MEDRIAALEVRMSALEAKAAAHDVRSEMMSRTVEDIGKDVKALLAKANQAKGGWAVIAAFSAVAGAVGGLIGMFVKGHGS